MVTGVDGYLSYSEACTQQKVQAHATLMRSFYIAYPLAKRTDAPLHTSLRVPVLPNRVLPISWNEGEKKSDVGNVHHLQQYLDYLVSGRRLKDGTEDMQIGTIVAVQPHHKRGIPWFGKVMKILEKEQQIQLVWFERKNNSCYYYRNELEMTSMDAIICNEVEFEPCFENEGLLWRLLTPIQFIKAMNSDTIPTLSSPLSKSAPVKKWKSMDVTALVFGNEEEFKQFLTVYK